MAYRLFQYALPTSSDLGDFNQFVQQHRVVMVQREIVSTPAGPLLTLLVEYVSTAATARAGGAEPTVPRVDYQQLLSAQEYAVFVRLRTWRKAIAEKDSVPLYAILTNAQLAEIVQKKCVSMADLQKIEGVAKGRLDKYGGGLLQILTETAAASQPVAAA